jgi:Ni,Fe-hydrogenase III component G
MEWSSFWKASRNNPPESKERMMKKALQKAETLLKRWSGQVTFPEENRMDVYVELKDLFPAVEALVKEKWGYLVAITGMDWTPKPPAEDEVPAGESHLEALYHFAVGPEITTLRVKLPYENPKVPTLCNLIPAATLFERELQELLGITVENTPNPDRLILPEDWPDGIYPLRKTFTGFNVGKEG